MASLIGSGRLCVLQSRQRLSAGRCGWPPTPSASLPRMRKATHLAQQRELSLVANLCRLGATFHRIRRSLLGDDKGLHVYVLVCVWKYIVYVCACCVWFQNGFGPRGAIPLIRGERWLGARMVVYLIIVRKYSNSVSKLFSKASVICVFYIFYTYS